MYKQIKGDRKKKIKGVRKKMKLTKEECLKMLNKLYVNSLLKCDDESIETLYQLIVEHFDNSFESEKSQLRYDLHFMEINFREAVDHMNEFLEKTIQLEKALDKGCKLLEKNVTKKQFCVDRYGEFDIDVPIRTKKEWKEFLLNED